MTCTLIAERAVHELLDYLVDHLPANMNVVLASVTIRRCRWHAVAFAAN